MFGATLTTARTPRSAARRPAPPRRAFTLVEVLIVVVIMALLAALVIPQLGNSTADAAESTLLYNLHTLRNQIQVYKAEHLGQVPKLVDGSLPQLTSFTDAGGSIGPRGTQSKLGPYVAGALPMNPLAESNIVVQAASVPPKVEQPGAGWLYDADTGQIWANSPDFLDR
jgi:prepilin-type N-terminal cleavage/methylation domain-containing protein